MNQAARYEKAGGLFSKLSGRFRAAGQCMWSGGLLDAGRCVTLLSSVCEHMHWFILLCLSLKRRVVGASLNIQYFIILLDHPHGCRCFAASPEVRAQNTVFASPADWVYMLFSGVRRQQIMGGMLANCRSTPQQSVACVMKMLKPLVYQKCFESGYGASSD